MENAITKVYGPVETALVVAGKKGVTNAQMIPVLKACLDQDDKDKLVLIQQFFPQVYTSSLRYLSKPYQQKLQALGL